MIRVTNIVWDFDEGEEGSYTELPGTVDIEEPIELDEVADYISDIYGWCISELDVEVIE